jgi:hypothetical protein
MVCAPEDIPGIKGSGRDRSGVMAPGDGLVVARVGGEASMEDLDEAVADMPESSVVRESSRTLAIVVGPRSRRVGKRRHRALTVLLQPEAMVTGLVPA